MRYSALLLFGVLACSDSAPKTGKPVDTSDRDASGDSEMQHGDDDGDGDGHDQRDAAANGQDAGKPPVFSGTVAPLLEKLTWRDLNWDPIGCNAKVATDLSTLPRLSWTAAPGAEGCEIHNFLSSDQDHISLRPAGTGYFSGYSINPDSGNAPASYGVVYYDRAGVPELAVRYPPDCGHASFGNADDTCWFFSYRDDNTYDDPPDQRFLGCGPIESPKLFPIEQTGGLGMLTKELVVALSGSAYTEIFDRTASAPTLTKLTDIGSFYSAVARGTTVIARLHTRPNGLANYRLMRSEDKGQWQTLLDLNPRSVLWFGGDDTQLAWLESDLKQDYYERVTATLMVAPWPAKNAPLVPRKVRDLADKQYFAAQSTYFGGYYAHGMYSAPARLYRVSDGAYWLVPLTSVQNPGLGNSETWLDGTHLTYSVFTMNDDQRSTLVRCPIAEIIKGPMQ